GRTILAHGALHRRHHEAIGKAERVDRVCREQRRQIDLRHSTDLSIRSAVKVSRPLAPELVVVSCGVRAQWSGRMIERPVRLRASYPLWWAPVMISARSSGARNDGGGGGPQLNRPRAPSRVSGDHSWSSTMQSMSE